MAVTRHLVNLAVAAVALAVSYGFVEGALFVLAGYGSDASKGSVFRYEELYVSNRPVGVFDRISGYRRPAGPTRIVRIVHDTVVFDRVFTPNNAGYISARTFQHAKPPGTARVLVLGDSFTAAEFNRKNWPDTVDDALRGRTPQPTELYSFAIDGGGLGLWHNIFFDDVVPNYPFDAVVIALFGDDLARGYSYLHYDGDKPYIGYFPTRAESDEDFFTNFMPRMKPHTAIVATDAEIDRMIAEIRPPWSKPEFKLRLPALVTAQIANLRRGAIPATAVALPPPAPEDPVDLAAIEARYGEQFALFRDIMNYCRDHNIPVVLASIPGRDSAQAAAESKGTRETPHQREVRVLAESFGARYMDGYAPFTKVPPEDIDGRYWLRFDGHWNQAGSDLFAAAMTDFLLVRRQNIWDRCGGDLAECWPHLVGRF